MLVNIAPEYIVFKFLGVGMSKIKNQAADETLGVKLARLLSHYIHYKSDSVQLGPSVSSICTKCSIFN